MKKFLVFLWAALLVFGVVATSSAVPVFYDDFDSENSGLYQLNYNNFANWEVTDGTVDLIGVGSPWDWFPEHGLYVDMDGSTGDAGIMTSNILLEAGQYSLRFDLAGNQRASTPEEVFVRVAMGSLLDETYSLGRTDPFQTFVETIIVPTATTVALSFEGSGGDNIGMLLDNVEISPVPEPATMLLLGSGLIGLAAVGRKKFFKKS